MLAHLEAVERQLAADFLLQITPTEHILEVAPALEAEEASLAVYGFSEVLFVQHDTRE